MRYKGALLAGWAGLCLVAAPVHAAPHFVFGLTANQSCDVYQGSTPIQQGIPSSGEGALAFSATGGGTFQVVATGTFVDTTPPATVTNLAVGSATSSSLTLTWTAPSANGGSAVLGYLPMVVFFWWATSPQGRRTVHSRVSRFERLVPSEQTTPEGETVMVPTHCYGSSTTDLQARLCATAHAVLPHLPHGYTWHGPFLVWDAPVPTREGPYLGSFHFKRRVHSGRPATAPPKGDLRAARALAHSILRRLAPE